MAYEYIKRFVWDIYEEDDNKMGVGPPKPSNSQKEVEDPIKVEILKKVVITEKK